MSGLPSTSARLLVAAPTMLDPNFERTVVFIVEHTSDGALGVVLNRPSETAVDEVFPAWRALALPPPSVFVGGPVQVGEAVIAFGRARPGVATASTPSFDGWQPLLGNVGSLDLGIDAIDALGFVDAVRVFAGYAGWGPGQLDDELAVGGWLVLDAVPDDLMSELPGSLWRRVLRRQRGEVAMTANQPPDPSVN